MLLHRPTGAAGAYREFRHAVLLDEALLDHHHRLGGNDEVATIAARIAGAERHGEAETQRIVRQRGGHRVTTGAKRGSATATEREAQLAVPAGTRLLSARGPWIADRIRRVINDGDPID